MFREGLVWRRLMMPLASDLRSKTWCWRYLWHKNQDPQKMLSKRWQRLTWVSGEMSAGYWGCCGWTCDDVAKKMAKEINYSTERHKIYDDSGHLLLKASTRHFERKTRYIQTWRILRLACGRIWTSRTVCCSDASVQDRRGKGAVCKGCYFFHATAALG